jgi:hypothetical protein
MSDLRLLRRARCRRPAGRGVGMLPISAKVRIILRGKSFTTERTETTEKNAGVRMDRNSCLID